jgi:hypothetical protein
VSAAAAEWPHDDEKVFFQQLGARIAALRKDQGKDVQPAKCGPAPKLQQQIERIQRPPRAKQRSVIEMLDTVLAQTSR